MGLDTEELIWDPDSQGDAWYPPVVGVNWALFNVTGCFQILFATVSSFSTVVGERQTQLIP